MYGFLGFKHRESMNDIIDEDFKNTVFWSKIAIGIVAVLMISFVIGFIYVVSLLIDHVEIKGVKGITNEIWCGQEGCPDKK